MRYREGKNLSGNVVRVIQDDVKGFHWFEANTDLFGTQYFRYLLRVDELPSNVEWSDWKE